MSLEAIALVKIPFDTLSQRFAAGATAEADGSAPARGANGMSFRVRPLRDASLVATSIPFASEPDEIALVLRKLLDDALDAHRDAHGIYVFPSAATPNADTYDGVVSEMGELGMWIPIVDTNYVPKRLAEAPDGTPQANLRDLMAAIPPDMMRAMEQAMSSGDPSVLESMQGQLQSLLASQGDLVQRLQESLLGAMGEGGGPQLPFDPSELPSEEEAPELWEQAREQLEALRKANPELVEQLEKQYGAAAPGRPPEKK